MEFSDLYGIWKPTKIFAETNPDECLGLLIVVSPNLMVVHSGEQEIKASCKIARRESGSDFTFIVTSLSVNEKVDPLGNSPEVVEERFPKLQIWRVVGKVVKILAPREIIEIEKYQEP